MDYSAEAKNVIQNNRMSIKSLPGQGDAAKASQGHVPKPKFEIYGEEMIEKSVRPSGKSGRVYLPQDWVGKNVKIIRLD